MEHQDAQQNCSAGIVEHTLPKPPGLIEPEWYADIGCGIRPVNWWPDAQAVLVEPYAGYCDVLRQSGHKPVNLIALNYLEASSDGFVPAIYLLDVIEHMHRPEGERVIELAQRKAERQVVIYTPKGFLEQEGDAWGLGGEHWQKHRSGWLPGDFPGWQVTMHGKGFFAVWTR